MKWLKIFLNGFQGHLSFLYEHVFYSYTPRDPQSPRGLSIVESVSGCFLGFRRCKCSDCRFVGDGDRSARSFIDRAVNFIPARKFFRLSGPLDAFGRKL